MTSNMLSSVEVCAGAGGQALGLEKAGFEHQALVEIDDRCRETLRHNRQNWNVVEGQFADISMFDGSPYKGVDLLAGGLPCPPFSVAGKQLGEHDERNLFPEAVRLVDQIRPKAVLIENVRGFLDPIFSEYREQLKQHFRNLGYEMDWRLLNACDFEVPQLRPRVAIVALQKQYSDEFDWPSPKSRKGATVGQTLVDLMSENGWTGATEWSVCANKIAPTIVGGSKKHGGPDLGPTRAKRAWAELGVDGMGIANYSPKHDFVGNPRLTIRMVARIQGFPDDWHFCGKKTPAYRQVGNAFPPPVAQALGESLLSALTARQIYQVVA